MQYMYAIVHLEWWRSSCICNTNGDERWISEDDGQFILSIETKKKKEEVVDIFWKVAVY